MLVIYYTCVVSACTHCCHLKTLDAIISKQKASQDSACSAHGEKMYKCNSQDREGDQNDQDGPVGADQSQVNAENRIEHEPFHLQIASIFKIDTCSIISSMKMTQLVEVPENP
ncbi:hypothetical protein chiPu_0001253 [Chiloscyllium punctatum]|uniref:Uncharacterized protein n=1 Tax=Chiloscyllium punctatum TaxID=137246 RepID=A0A401RXK0_CHIPU|nr:hypothetical protein [Chiloscyllium punctatum]